MMNKDNGNRNLNYFGHKDDGRCTLFIRHMNIPKFLYRSEHPSQHKNPESDAKNKVICKLRVKKEHNMGRFLNAPERKNVWTGGIRSQCEGVLTAKNYQNPADDCGVYTVIPEIEASRVTVDDIYKMWLALESAMMRREFLIIVEDPALAQVTKYRTERWRLMSQFLRWGSIVSIIFATILYRYRYFYCIPLSLAMYGNGMLNAMKSKDPASRYSECCANKQFELDPSSSEMCDAHISLKYLRSPQYRMFKLEDHLTRDKENRILIWTAFLYSIIAMVRNIYSHDYAEHIIKSGFTQGPTGQLKLHPLNVFNQLKNRFITLGNSPGPGRVNIIHWLMQNGLFYYFFLRRIPWIFQTCLEYVEREYMMETSIRYLQFRNLQGEERYEFPARNLYRTMQKDFPKNRVLKEMYDHFHQPKEGYYESKEFLETRQPKEISIRDALRRWRVSYYRNW